MTTNTARYLSSTAYVDFADIFAARTILRRIRDNAASYRLKQQIQRERRELEQLPEHLLRDMGLDKADVLQEVRRGFHDIPAQRRHDSCF